MTDLVTEYGQLRDALPMENLPGTEIPYEVGLAAMSQGIYGDVTDVPAGMQAVSVSFHDSHNNRDVTYPVILPVGAEVMTTLDNPSTGYRGMSVKVPYVDDMGATKYALIQVHAGSGDTGEISGARLDYGASLALASGVPHASLLDALWLNQESRRLMADSGHIVGQEIQTGHSLGGFYATAMQIYGAATQNNAPYALSFDSSSAAQARQMLLAVVRASEDGSQLAELVPNLRDVHFDPDVLLPMGEDEAEERDMLLEYLNDGQSRATESRILTLEASRGVDSIVEQLEGLAMAGVSPFSLLFGDGSMLGPLSAPLLRPLREDMLAHYQAQGIDPDTLSTRELVEDIMGTGVAQPGHRLVLDSGHRIRELRDTIGELREASGLQASLGLNEVVASLVQFGVESSGEVCGATYGCAAVPVAASRG